MIMYLECYYWFLATARDIDDANLGLMKVPEIDDEGAWSDHFSRDEGTWQNDEGTRQIKDEGTRQNWWRCLLKSMNVPGNIKRIMFRHHLLQLIYLEMIEITSLFRLRSQ